MTFALTIVVISCEALFLCMVPVVVCDVVKQAIEEDRRRRERLGF